MTALESSDARRRRLLWRASHRGIKEMDLILGSFAAARISHMDEAELAELETIIEIPDQELLAWATKTAEIPAKHRSALLLEFLEHRS